MPVMSKLVEHDPVIMVSSPRPLPPISDFGQLGLPASLRQVGVVWGWVCTVCVLGRGGRVQYIRTCTYGMDGCK